MEKLHVKDFINIGIFTVLLYVLSLLVAFVGITPVSSLFASPLYALLAGPIFMLYIAKTKKPFAISVTGLFCSVLCLLSFTSIVMAGISLACFLVADFIASRKNYSNFVVNTIAYLVFSLWSLAVNGGYWYLQDFMVAFSLESGMEQSWLDGMVAIATPLNFVLMVLGTLIAAFISTIFAKIMFKKHFKKAGII